MVGCDGAAGHSGADTGKLVDVAIFSDSELWRDRAGASLHTLDFEVVPVGTAVADTYAAYLVGFDSGLVAAGGEGVSAHGAVSAQPSADSVTITLGEARHAIALSILGPPGSYEVLTASASGLETRVASPETEDIFVGILSVDAVSSIELRRVDASDTAATSDPTSPTSSTGTGTSGDVLWWIDDVLVPPTKTLDDDGDGYAGDVDCDNANPEVNPGEVEEQDNGVDDDCDGEVDELPTDTGHTTEPRTSPWGFVEASTAYVALEAESGTGLGLSLARVRGLGTPGFDAILVGGVASGEGGAWLWYGPLPPGNAESDFMVSGDADAALGTVLAAAGPLDGEGTEGFVVAGAAQTLLFQGAWRGVAFAADADVVLAVSAASVVADADLDGDGVPDLAMGVGGALTVARLGGWATPSTKITSTSSGGTLGATLAAGDVNGDGYLELVAGAPALECDGAVLGGALVLFGPIAEGELDGDSAGAVRCDSAGGTVDGALLVADLDADGFAEIVAGSPDYGQIFGWVGSTAVEALLTPDWRTSHTEGLGLGASLAAGDVDGDGLADLLAGAPDSGGGIGEALLFPGGEPWPEDAGTAGGTLRGAAAEDGFGTSVVIADTSGDGLGDVSVGAPYAGGGTVYTWLGTARK